MQPHIASNTIRQILLLSVIILMAFIIGKEMYFLLGAFLGALTFYILLRRTMYTLVLKHRFKQWVAALLLILICLSVVVMPMFWVGSVIYKKMMPFINNPAMLNDALNTIHNYLSSNYGIDLLNESNINKIKAQVFPYVQKSIGGTLNFVGNLFILFFVLFFMLINSTKIELWLRRSLPFKPENTSYFINDFRNLVKSNAIGIPVVAFVQGLVGMIGYMIFGVQEFVLMGILTMICSVIPVVGAMLIYVPICIYLIAIGHYWQGIGAGLWGFILIGSIDNVARFLLQKKLADVHPLITIFGVIIGVNIFGFFGVIFGPILLSMFILLSKIYINEFGDSEIDYTKDADL